MKNKLLFLIFLVLIPLFFSSCASILNGSEQDIDIKTNSNDSKVYIDDKLVGTGRNIHTKLYRNMLPKQVRVDREGYKSQYSIVYQNSKSPWYIMSWVPFGVLLLQPPMYDVQPTSFDYDSELVIDQSSLKIPERTEKEKYVYINKTSMDMDKDQFVIHRMSIRDYRDDDGDYRDKKTNSENINYDNTLFSDLLNKTLYDFKYVDTTRSIMRKKTNTLYINSSVNDVDFQYVYDDVGNYQINFLKSNTNVTWELTDIYGQVKLKKEIDGESGEFAIPEETNDKNIEKCFSDAVEDSFFKFMNLPKTRELIKKTADKEIKMKMLTMSPAQTPENIAQAMKSTVTIKTDNGHGSGFAVSKDGYIVTNLHVVATSDNYLVIDNDGEEFKADLIRQNEFKDLALLKINKKFDYSFDFTSDANYEVGDEIFAIGTPNSIELGQSLSKGIISGIRDNKEEHYIQTDASVNGGNSGGPLINKEGELIGVVNAKIKGIGIEGIGFSIPVFEIKEGLFLN